MKETKSQEREISSYDWKIKYSPTPLQDRDLIDKVGCMFPLVKWSEFRHRENATHFITNLQ